MLIFKLIWLKRYKENFSSLIKGKKLFAIQFPIKFLPEIIFSLNKLCASNVEKLSYLIVGDFLAMSELSLNHIRFYENNKIAF